MNELRDLQSTLETHNPQNLYAVPYGYFEGLPTRIMNRIKALKATSPKEELRYLSSLLSNVSRETPYSVPVDFFQNFGDNVMQRINRNANHLPAEYPGQTSEEEIESLSPLLGSLRNKNPYSVPDGYFDSLETNTEKKEAKVISIKIRRWYRMAVAALVIGIVAVSGLLLINRKNSPISDSQAGTWIKNKVMNKVSPEKIDEFVTLVTPAGTQKPVEENDAAAQAEVKELMKDVPQKEIDDFLNDAVALESNDDINALMNE